MLRYFRHGIDSPPVHRDGHEIGWRRGVVVPYAVMHSLEVPLALTGARVQTEERLREQIGAEPTTTPVSPLGVLVGTYSRPRSGSRDISPHTLACPVKRHDSSSQVSAPNESLDCGTVKNTHLRSPVCTSNACTEPGVSKRC